MVPVACSWKVCNLRLGILLAIFVASNVLSCCKIYSIYTNEWQNFLSEHLNASMMRSDLVVTAGQKLQECKLRKTAIALVYLLRSGLELKDLLCYTCKKG